MRRVGSFSPILMYEYVVSIPQQRLIVVRLKGTLSRLSRESTGTLDNATCQQLTRNLQQQQQGAQQHSQHSSSEVDLHAS
mmetsp:Transcript_8800/g.17980  ORF Transcript_8800/g.17980 Transcript_8800/m.17980 type:complete len:80 (+) Transcript_8800:1261-1500(+)